MSNVVPLEAAVVKRVRNAWKKRGGWLFKTNGDGLPDLVGVYKGVFFGVEVKRPSGTYEVTPLQKIRLQQIRDAGGVGIVARHEDDLTRWMDVVDDLHDSGVAWTMLHVDGLPEIG